MHIDPANEGQTQEQMLIEQPDEEPLHQELVSPQPKDEGSLIISIPASRDCLGQSPTTRQTNVD